MTAYNQNTLVLQLRQTIKDVAEHEHHSEDFYCMNLVGWMGERMKYVLNLLDQAQADIDRLEAAAPEPPACAAKGLTRNGALVPCEGGPTWVGIPLCFNGPSDANRVHGCRRHIIQYASDMNLVPGGVRVTAQAAEAQVTA